MIVADGRGHGGYIQRPLLSHGRVYWQRTFFRDGEPSARIYRPWFHGNQTYYIYRPEHYHPAEFLGWVGRPWAAPVAYQWRWTSQSWSAQYRTYFTPSPTYPTPGHWLADYAVSRTLEMASRDQAGLADAQAKIDAYKDSQDKLNTAVGNFNDTIKELLTKEVDRQVEGERNELRAGLDEEDMAAPPPLFTNEGPRVFLVSNPVIGYSGNQECGLKQGDVIQLEETPGQDAEWAQVKILACRGSNLGPGSALSVKTADLQEMANDMHAIVNQGMDELQKGQGTRGLPADLPQGAGGTVSASYTADISPDSNRLAEFSQAVKNADQAEMATIGSNQ